MNENINEYLQKIGLTEYEVKIYMTMLEKDNCSASELAQASGVPRSKTYEILNNLSNKGLCIEVPDTIKRYSAIKPVTAINTLKQKLAADHQEKIDILNLIENKLIDIYSNRSYGESGASVIQIYREKNTIWQSIQDLLNSAENEILVFSKEPFIVSVGHNTNSMKQINKEVQIRSIYEEKDVLRNDYQEGIKSFLKEGEQVKIVQELPVKMTIIDNKLVLLIMKEKNNSGNDLLAIVINQAELANTFRIIFEFFWMQGNDPSAYLNN
jgi:sugar-specific transcriptional regulator TrmB